MDWNIEAAGSVALGLGTAFLICQRPQTISNMFERTIVKNCRSLNVLVQPPHIPLQNGMVQKKRRGHHHLKRREEGDS